MTTTEELIETFLAETEAFEAAIKVMNSCCEDKYYKDLLETSEVCYLLHVTPRTLLNYRDKGLLSCIQIGSKFYYEPKEIKNLLDSNRITN